VFLAPPGASGSAFEFNFAVRTANGEPVGGYWIEIWHADSRGVYDLSNPRPPDAADEMWPNTAFFRTRRFIYNASSRTVWTVCPGQYFDNTLGVAREPHLHVVVDVPSRPLLTTQVFMPRDPSLPPPEDPHYDPQNTLSPVVRLANGTTIGWFVFRVP
jgi:protocatechuate 3,4-dioxygenase beta subunit